MTAGSFWCECPEGTPARYVAGVPGGWAYCNVCDMPVRALAGGGSEEGEPETIFDPVEPLDDETVEKLRNEHGIEFSGWRPQVPLDRLVFLVKDDGPNRDEAFEEIVRRLRRFENEAPAWLREKIRDGR